MWNVQGLTKDKINDPEFQNIVNDFDIISFVETWTGETQEVELSNFEFIHSSSRKKNRKARRYSGGINIFAKHEYKNGIKPLKIAIVI